MEKLELGTVYRPGNPAPKDIIESLEFIKHRCEDLKGAEIDAAKMIIKTNFSVDIDPSERTWSSETKALEPPWWAELANLPENYESLLVIQRKSVGVVIGD